MTVGKLSYREGIEKSVTRVTKCHGGVKLDLKIALKDDSGGSAGSSSGGDSGSAVHGQAGFTGTHGSAGESTG